MWKHLKIGSLIVFFLIGFAHQSQASHLRAGEITVERVSCNGLSYRITITAYPNTGSSIRFSSSGLGLLNFGDGTFHNLPQTENTPFSSDVGFVRYTVEHVFPGPGSYKITYKESFRNKGILNMSNSDRIDFFLETLIIIDPFIGCDNSPILSIPPIDKECTGKAWYHNPGASDPDGDLLTYELVVPRQNKNVAVNNYLDPNVREFYDRIGLNYCVANEQQNGPPNFTIDWDGRDNSKREVSAGIYYYEAQVTFDSVDPSKKNRMIKGWVQILC
jgi:hypothetical protein